MNWPQMNAKAPQTTAAHDSAVPATAGLGGANYRMAIYLANRPPLDDYPQLDTLRPMFSGELDHIVCNTSNHWRKVFSVYAKFLFELKAQQSWPECDDYKRWQDYRDQRMLQSNSEVALLFSPPHLLAVSPLSSASNPVVSPIHIIAGKTYAETLGLSGQLTWLDAHFAVIEDQRLIVCPYLDYRQLSNERIGRLVGYIQRFWGKNSEFEQAGSNACG